MTRPKREPRAIKVADIARRFELSSYWFGRTWCPAVDRKASGFSIRIMKSESVSGRGRAITYDYFELDADGVITTAPRGHAKDWKPGRVIDIEAVADWYAKPQEDAMRLNLGGGL